MKTHASFLKTSVSSLIITFIHKEHESVGKMLGPDNIWIDAISVVLW